MSDESSELRAEKLSYEINDALILSDISLSVKSGQILFIEGGNGSGKTTLLRILSGLMPADEGQVRWNGRAIDEDRLEYNQQFTYIGHTSAVKPELTVLENIQFFSVLAGAGKNNSLESALDWAGLKQYQDSPGRYLSFGQQRRVALARLLVEPSKLWIMDEPFAGLDKTMITALRNRFHEHVSTGGLIILTSHQMIQFDELDAVHLRLDS